MKSCAVTVTSSSGGAYAIPGFSVNVPSAVRRHLRIADARSGWTSRRLRGRPAVVGEQRSQQATAVERPRDAVVLLLRVERLLYVRLQSELQRPTYRRLAGRGEPLSCAARPSRLRTRSP